MRAVSCTIFRLNKLFLHDIVLHQNLCFSVFSPPLDDSFFDPWCAAKRTSFRINVIYVYSLLLRICTSKSYLTVIGKFCYRPNEVALLSSFFARV